MSFLAIDIGNTRLKWVLYEYARLGAPVLSQGAEFLEQIEHLSELAWLDLPTPQSALACNVAGRGVQERVREQIELMERWDLELNWISASDHAAGLINGYDHPERLGNDRWAALIGAWHDMLSRGLRRPVLLVMVGTAVTVEAIDAKGRYLGGLILPGHGIMLRALEAGTAGLHVPTGEVRDFPTNTSDALTSGGTYAIAGACEHMASNLQRHCGQEPLCLMTGGAGWKMLPHMCRPFELRESLVFDGILVLAAENERLRNIT